jgi:hypothetical protein
MWQQTIRTGSWEGDQRAVEQLKAHAASQGVQLQVVALPDGGFQCTALAAAGGRCQACGRAAPTKKVEFMRNIGALVMRFSRTVRGEMCKRCASKFYWEFTLVTLFAGWWGVISFFYTLYILPANTVYYLGTLGMKDS